MSAIATDPKMDSTAGTAAARLLTDDQVRQFLVQGYVQLNVDLPREVHEAVYRKVDEATLNRGHVGNNVYPTVPELREVYESPAVRGALASVLGPSYIMHQHRYLHGNHPGQNAEPRWHKDSYWGYYRKVRSHRSWWAMIMYYPQDTREENGPTSILPGRQHYLGRDANDDRGCVKVTGSAGTFFLVHYDIWHAAAPNTSDKRRYMSKFEFLRLDTPKALGGPTWNCSDRRWREPSEHTAPFRHRTMWRTLWDWMADNTHAPPAGDTDGVGRWLEELANQDPNRRATAADELGLIGPAAPGAATALANALIDTNETVRLNAAYALAAIGKAAVPALISNLAGDNDTPRYLSACALGAMGQAAQSELIDLARSGSPRARAAAAFALGEQRDPSPEAVAALSDASGDTDPIARLWAVEALGMLGAAARPAVARLGERLSDPENEVAMFAAVALARIGPTAAEAVPALIRALKSSNRYVRGHSIEALQRIGTRQAVTAALDDLKATRWCASTTPDSPFHP